MKLLHNGASGLLHPLADVDGEIDGCTGRCDGCLYVSLSLFIAHGLLSCSPPCLSAGFLEAYQWGRPPCQGGEPVSAPEERLPMSCDYSCDVM